jgi:hypothetical protein
MPATAKNTAVSAALENDSPPEASDAMETAQKPKNQRCQRIAMKAM